ncbi:MAG: CpcT/CpeT family chromophore lyase [Rhodospirillaceae bacterium]
MTSRLKIACIILAAWVLPVKVQAETLSQADLAQLLEWVQGRYSNQQQFDTGGVTKASDLLFPVFEQIDVPAFGDSVIYLQWPIGSSTGDLQRQRIWVFNLNETTGRITMDFFTLKEPDVWLNAHLYPQKVRGMTREDTIGYPETCLLPVSREGDQFVARIPKTCEIVSQGTQTTMTLESHIVISSDQLTYREAGLKADGSVVFRVPATGEYVFDRLID